MRQLPVPLTGRDSGYAALMTDQAYDERDDERESQEAARGRTEEGEEGTPYTPGEPEPDETESGS